MARTPRLWYPGATHHLFNRAIGEIPLFADDEDRASFLRIVARLPGRFGLLIRAYALMTTHFHLAAVDVQGRVSAGMAYLKTCYVRALNDRRGRDGSAFRGRFANRVVESADYERHLYAYLHLNPVLAGLASHPAQAIWTSHPAAIGAAPAPSWLDLSWVTTVYGGRLAFAEYVEAYDPADGPFGDVPTPVTDERVSPLAPLVGVTPVADALGLAARIAGLPRQEIRKARGHAGEFVAWTLCARAGLTQREAGAVLRLTPAAVGQRLRRFEDWSESAPIGRAWRAWATEATR